MNIVTKDGIGLTSMNLRRAADIKDQIDSLQTELESIFNPMPKLKGWTPDRRKKYARTIARNRSIIQPVGWEKKPRKMSAKVRARLSTVAKHRWARAHAAGRNHI